MKLHLKKFIRGYSKDEVQQFIDGGAIIDVSIADLFKCKSNSDEIINDLINEINRGGFSDIYHQLQKLKEAI